jgi:hypothetical protein
MWGKVTQMVKKDFAGVCAAALIGSCLLTGMLRASVGITPAFVEVNMDEGRPAGTFLISNLGDKEERFRVNALYFIYTEEGTLKKSQTGDYSLASWIRFNPRELTLAPGTQRAVRFAIIPRGKLEKGEHWAAMELESLTVNEIVSKDEKSGRSTKVKVVTTILVPIFGTVGEASYSGEVKDLQVRVENNAIALKALLAATGSGRLQVKGSYQIVDASGKVIDTGPFAAGYVFRGGQRWFTRNIEAAIPKGEYTVKVSVEAPHLEQPLVKEATVTWPERPPVIAGANTEGAVPSASAKQPSQPQNPKDGNKQTEMQGSAGTE